MQSRSVVVSILALVSILAFAGPASAAHRHHRKHHRHHRHHRRHAAPRTPSAPVAPPAPAAQTTPPAPTQTPTTVANVCHLDPGLGQAHFVTVGGMATAYWTYDTGAVRMLTYSDDGDTAVDAAGALSPDGTVTYVARCDWSVWVSAPPLAQTGSSTSITGLVDFIWSAGHYFDPITPDGPGCAGAGGIYGGSCYPG